MADVSYRAVLPMVVGYREDGGQTYAYQGDPILGLSKDEVDRLLGKGAIEKVEPPAADQPPAKRAAAAQSEK